MSSDLEGLRSCMGWGLKIHAQLCLKFSIFSLSFLVPRSLYLCTQLWPTVLQELTSLALSPSFQSSFPKFMQHCHSQANTYCREAREDIPITNWMAWMAYNSFPDGEFVGHLCIRFSSKLTQKVCSSLLQLFISICPHFIWFSFNHLNL